MSHKVGWRRFHQIFARRAASGSGAVLALLILVQLGCDRPASLAEAAKVEESAAKPDPLEELRKLRSELARAPDVTRVSVRTAAQLKPGGVLLQTRGPIQQHDEPAVVRLRVNLQDQPGHQLPLSEIVAAFNQDIVGEMLAPSFIARSATHSTYF